MNRSHRYSGLQTIGDMKRAIADAEKLGYDDASQIRSVVFFAPDAYTYEFSRRVVVARPATDEEVQAWLGPKKESPKWQ